MAQHAEAQQQVSASNNRDMNGSVALLFLTIKDVKNPDIWEGWLSEADPNTYDIYVHAKRKTEVQHRLFKDRHVDTVPTKWGTVSLVRAHVNLLRAAVRNKRNKWFFLLSDSCLPIVSFETLCKRLQEEFVRDSKPISAFDTHPGAQQKDQRKNVEQLAVAARRRWEEEEGCGGGEEMREAMRVMSELVAEEGVVSHSQWCMLGRADAEAIAGAGELEAWLEAYRRLLPLQEVRDGRTLAADELLLLSLLRARRRKRGAPYKENADWARGKTTFSHCCIDPAGCRCSIARAAHPLSYAALHPDIVSQCVLNRSLFARKFEAGMRLQEWRALWEAGEPATMLRVASLSLQLSRPDLLTERQQLNLALQLSQIEQAAAQHHAAGPWDAFSAQQRGKKELAWEEEVGRFGRGDTLRVVEIVCREELEEGSGDGLCAAVLHRHVRGEEFVVRFKDGEEVQVDLGTVKVRGARPHVVADMQDVVRASRRHHAPAKPAPPTAKKPAQGGRKRGREAEAAGGGGVGQKRSREEAKMEAWLRQIAALEKREARRKRPHTSPAQPQPQPQPQPASPPAKEEEEEEEAFSCGEAPEDATAAPLGEATGGEVVGGTGGVGGGGERGEGLSEGEDGERKSSGGSSPVTVKAEDETAEEHRAQPIKPAGWPREGLAGGVGRVGVVVPVAAVAVPVLEQPAGAADVVPQHPPASLRPALPPTAQTRTE